MPINETAFRNGFETQHQEVYEPSLTVQGNIPDWLVGTYVRNGPGQFDLGDDKRDPFGRYWHWFDGLAMPHRYKFENGTVGFANRYLRTETYKKDRETGKLNFRMSATDPKRSGWDKFLATFGRMAFTDNTNIHTMELAGEYVALTERQEAYVFDLDTLETKGMFRYDKSANNNTQTAHTHYDPATRIKYNLMLSFGLSSAYELYTLKDRRYTLLGRIPVRAPSYMHSFSMTENYIVLTEYPLRISLLGTFQFLWTDTPYLDNFSWRPQDGTNIVIIDRKTGNIVKQVQADACFSFHHINAFEQGDSVIVDISAYADGSVIQGLYVDTMKSDVEYSTMTAEFRRYTIDMQSYSALASVGYDLTTDDRIMLPRINYNHYNTKPYRYAYGLSTAGNKRDFVNEIVKIDVDHAMTDKRWHVEGHYPSEPVFAPRPNATAEDDGLVMSTVYNSETDKSYLLLLDGQTFNVQATADLLIRIPFGFHGRWYPNGNMYAL
ncbi:MAG: carotenoid oxygenase family protein [Chloroflexota bacterium]